MHQIISTIISTSLIFLLSLSSSFAQGQPVKLGVFTNITGPDEYAAKAFNQGIQLALDKQSPVALTAQFFDFGAGSSPDNAQLKALVETDRIPLAIYWNVDQVTPVAQYLTNSKVIGFVSWEVTKKVARLSNHIYGFGYSTESSFKQLAKFAGNKLKSYRFGVISTSDDHYDTQSKAFIEESKSLGNTIVFDEKVGSDNQDFKALVTRAQKENCDTIFATLPAPALISFIKAARAASYKGKLIVGDSLFSSDLQQLGKDAEGIHMTQAWTDDAQFKSSYAAKFGAETDNVTLGVAALGYDTINCILSSDRPLDSGSIKYSLLSKPCEGLTGNTLFSGERIAQRRKRILTVKDGQFNLAE